MGTVVSLVEFVSYLRATRLHWEELSAHLRKRRVARTSFDFYINKRKSVSSFLRSLAYAPSAREHPREKRRLDLPVLAYGDANLKSTGKGERGVPVKYIYREAALVYKTVMVDEYRTTRVHCDCGKDTAAFRVYGYRQEEEEASSTREGAAIPGQQEVSCIRYEEGGTMVVRLLGISIGKTCIFFCLIFLS
jgi:hypothetical protein